LDIIRDFAVNAFDEVVSWHTVGIVGDDGRGPGSGIGAGTAVSWRGRTVILTARHVVERSTTAELEFLLRPPGNIGRDSVYEPESVLTGGIVFKQKLTISDMRLSETDDLAALFVPPGIAESYNVRFHELDSDDAVPSGGSVIMFTGFPAALAQRVNGAGRAACRSIAYQRILDQPAFGEFDPKRHFACDYTYGEGPVEPQGHSGAGAWFDRGNDAQVWTVQLGFAGVLTAYHRQRGLLEGVRVEIVREFMDSIV